MCGCFEREWERKTGDNLLDISDITFGMLNISDIAADIHDMDPIRN